MYTDMQSETTEKLNQQKAKIDRIEARFETFIREQADANKKILSKAHEIKSNIYVLFGFIL